jgi:hypothetical protein
LVTGEVWAVTLRRIASLSLAFMPRRSKRRGDARTASFLSLGAIMTAEIKLIGSELSSGWQALANGGRRRVAADHGRSSRAITH